MGKGALEEPGLVPTKFETEEEKTDVARDDETAVGRETAVPIVADDRAVVVA